MVMTNERGQNTHSKGEQVKIPLLPKHWGKASVNNFETIWIVTTASKHLCCQGSFPGVGVFHWKFFENSDSWNLRSSCSHLVLFLVLCISTAFGCWAYPKAGRNIFFMCFSTFFVNFKPFSVISRLKSTYFWTRVKLNVTIVKQIMLIFVIDF